MSQMNKLYDSFTTYIRCELNLSARTVSSYTYDLGQWQRFTIDAFGEDFDPARTTVGDIRLWVAHLSRQGISQRSIRRKIQTLRAFFHYLMLRHGLAANPAAEITPARLPKPLPRAIRPADTVAVMRSEADAADFIAVRNRLVVDILYSTGMRASELASLRTADINLAAGSLRVMGKRRRERVIPFGEQLAADISAYLNLRPADSAPTLLVDEAGEPLQYRHILATVKQQFAAVGTAATPHALRHSCATDMLNGGAELTAVQQLLGHASLATTQIYTHLSFRDLKQNYQLAHPRALKHG